MGPELIAQSFFTANDEDALRSQVHWLHDSLRFQDGFFSSILRVDPLEFVRWRNEAGALAEDKQDSLIDFWQLVHHFLSLYDYDLERTRMVFSFVAPNQPGRVNLRFYPPWTGQSLAEYLEQSGPSAISEVKRWVQELRFADSY